MGTIDNINDLNKSDFLSIFGNVFEKTESVAQEAFESKPFKEFDDIVFKMLNIYENYKKEILGEKPLFAVEAGVINGWEKYINFKNFIGMSSFGASGPYKDVYKNFGITSNDICEKIQLHLNL